MAVGLGAYVYFKIFGGVSYGAEGADVGNDDCVDACLVKPFGVKA